MAFVWKKITDQKEKEYIKLKGFTYIDGEPMIDQRWCAIDEERDIILVSRGGGEDLKCQKVCTLFRW